MRKLVLVSLFVVACGGSSKSSGGGEPTGTVGGKAFSPTEVKAIVARTATPCSITAGTIPLDVGVSALALTFTSYANACGDFTSTQCTLHANAQSVTVLHAILDASGKPPPLAPGTFTIHSSATTVIPDPGNVGRLTAGFAEALSTAAAPACSPTTATSVEGGTLTITQVTATEVKGHLSVTFTGGGNLEGDFTAAVCSDANPDICALASAGTGALCQGTPTCVP